MKTAPILIKYIQKELATEARSESSQLLEGETQV